MTSQQTQPPQDKYVRKKSFIIALDSRNATIYSNGSANSEVTFELKYPIITPKDCIYMTWVVNAFTCPLSWYLINATNDYLSLDLSNNTHYDIYIPHGNYNMNTFISQLSSKLPAGFTITKNTIDNKLTLINSTTDFFINANSTIYQIMGFIKNQSIQSVNKTLTMPYTCNFSGLNSINIFCENIRTTNLDSFDQCATSSIIATVPVNASSNGTIYYEKRNDFEFDVKENTIDYLDILIEDDVGNKIDFNNQSWNLTLQINYIRDVVATDETFYDIYNSI